MNLYDLGGWFAIFVALGLMGCGGALSRSDKACMVAHLGCVAADIGTTELGVRGGSCVEANILLLDPDTNELSSPRLYLSSVASFAVVAIAGEVLETYDSRGREMAHCSAAAIRCSAGIANATKLEACLR